MSNKLTLQRIVKYDGPSENNEADFIERITFAGSFKVCVHYADNEPFRIMVGSATKPETFEATEDNMRAYRTWVMGPDV